MSAPQGNRVLFDSDVARDIDRLPHKVQEQFVELLILLKEDIFHPLLHTKPLSPPLQGMFSFRIARDYRAGFKFYSPHAVLLLAVDRRDKIYQRLERKI